MKHELKMLRKGLFFVCTLLLCACGGQVHPPVHEVSDSLSGSQDSAVVEQIDTVENAEPGNVPQVATTGQFENTETVAAPKPEKRFIVVSKLHENLSVYDVKNGDTILLSQYPACMGKNKGNKEKKGDMKTPESPKGKPFYISQIADAHTWHHDFGDGRGSILAYGHWFLRLNTPGHSGIGIHGSTNNESTVPGRASEGCIRLRDSDIIDLKEKYAYVGMPVIVKAEGEE